mmetsp:Transcript_14059/g.23880  ORF Transcript_14059/g.23880 Transcript_14059/m.23880 type:complete len:140 (-) Transcript_14059:241-660(-)
MFMRFIVVGLLVSGLGASLYGLSTQEFFSAGHTNSMNAYFYLLAHLAMILGPAGMIGLKFLNFAIYPRKKFDHVISLSPYLKSSVKRGILHPNFIMGVPLALFGLQLYYCDKMHFIQAAFGMLAFAFPATSLYLLREIF